MSAVEVLEKSKVKLTFEIPPDVFREALVYSYNKNKGRLQIPGFRKGKVPRKVAERLYGKEFFYDDALNHALPDAYEAAVEAEGVDPVSRPAFDLVEAGEESGAVLTAEVYVRPEVSIDGYYGLTYTKTETEPTDADIQERLQAEREKNARLLTVDEPAQNGDTLIVNFTGYTDGEPFENGAATNHELTLGSHSFIDTFEDQLVGHGAGDDVEVNVTFPEQYHAEALAGKPALFKVEVLEVKRKEYPEIDDEFAQDVSEFDTLAEYRDSLADKIREAKVRQADAAKREQVLGQLREKAVTDIPEAMVEFRAEREMDMARFNMRMQGMDMDNYMKYTGQSEADMLAQFTQRAREAVRTELALEAVAAHENLTVSDEECEAEIKRMAETRRQTEEKVKDSLSPARMREIKQDLLYPKAIDFVLEKAVAVDPPAEA